MENPAWNFRFWPLAACQNAEFPADRMTALEKSGRSDMHI
jgi:hypothetical protein